MITNIRLETSDPQRSRIAMALLGRQSPVSRSELKDIVQEYIDELVKAGPDYKADPEPAAVFAAKKMLDDQPIPKDVGFTPSRGDEAYLAQPSHPEIAAACSRILDDAALIEQFAWDTVERNRK